MDNMSARLDSDSQVAISKIVSSLPEEPLSLVWRSELNESLRAVSNQNRKRKRMFNFLSPLAGLSVACALAGIVLFRTPHTSRLSSQSPVVASAGPSLEASLFHAQQDDMRASDVAGAGLSRTEAADNAISDSQASQDELEDDIQL
jgi:hypothetical protein